MDTSTEHTDDHFGPDCPQCRAMADQAKSLGDFAEAMEKVMIPAARRLGREMARRRNEVVLKAIMGDGYRP
jgi:hypothetical protein